MLKKEDISIEIHQGETISNLKGTGIEFRIYLRTVDGTSSYEVEMFAELEDEIQLDKIVDMHSLVEKVIIKNNKTGKNVREVLVNSYPSFAIISNDLDTIRQSLCFSAKNLI